MNNAAPFVIAIDGLAASGKGTLASRLARTLDYACLDTGKLYRVAALRILGKGENPENEDSAVAAARELAARYTPDLLANPEAGSNRAGQAASVISVFPGVRDALVDLQKRFAAAPPEGKQGAVLDGRDIGTVICPGAQKKIFVTADLPVRARRRFKELQSKGMDVTYDAVFAEMQERDARDMTRAAAPLRAAEDAFVLDTSALSPDETFEKAYRFVTSV